MKMDDVAPGGGRGAFGLRTPPGRLRVPASVEAVLAARIDRLAPGDKALLQAAAGIGDNVPVALLQTVAELSGPDLRDALARRRAAQVRHDIRLLPESYGVLTHRVTRTGAE